jgi:F-type H+-transporting ATPase subunit delta
MAVAREDGNVQEWLDHLARAAGVVGNPEASAFFKDPNVSQKDKASALESLFADVPVHVLNLLRLLVITGRLHLVPSILAEMRGLDREARGIVEAQVTVARCLADSEVAEIARRLGEATGRTIEIRARVDESILGGIVVRMGDRLVDASVKGRLDRLRGELAT